MPRAAAKRETSQLDLLKGTLDVLVLKTLSWGSMHGYAVTRWIRQRSGGQLAVEDAALYQALHRMERRGWLEAEWGRSENNRRAKFYRLTPKGRKQLTSQTREIRSYLAALLEVLEAKTAAHPAPIGTAAIPAGAHPATAGAS